MGNFLFDGIGAGNNGVLALVPNADFAPGPCARTPASHPPPLLPEEIAGAFFSRSLDADSRGRCGPKMALKGHTTPCTRTAAISLSPRASRTLSARARRRGPRFAMHRQPQASMTWEQLESEASEYHMAVTQQRSISPKYTESAYQSPIIIPMLLVLIPMR